MNWQETITRDSACSELGSRLSILCIQMHGEPGSGKSTLAKALGRALPAIVIDKDTIKSAMLKSGIAESQAGPGAYEVMWELGADLLDAGHSVIFDSPCFWPSIERRGQALARRFGVDWKMIEVTCLAAVIDERLATRSARVSNPTIRQNWNARAGTYRPDCERLIVDGTTPIEDLVQQAVAYIGPAVEALPHGRTTDGGSGHSDLVNTPHSALSESEGACGKDGPLSTQHSALSTGSSGLGTRDSGLAI